MSTGKKSTIYAILNESAVLLLDEERWVEARAVVLRARRLHPAVFAAEQERLIMQAARRIAKEVMKDLSEDDESSTSSRLALFDLALPTAIAVPDTDDDGDGFKYIRSDKANWPELLAGANVRDRNVERAQAKRDAYWESVDVLRPIMEKQPGLTVADAMRILRAGHAA